MIEMIKNIFKRKQEITYTVEDKINDLFLQSVNADILRIEIGEDICGFGDLICNVIDNVRNEVYNKNGFILPSIHVVDNSNLQENQYNIYVRGKCVLDDYIVVNCETVEKEFLQAIWKIIDEYIDDILTNEAVERYFDGVRSKNDWMVYYLYCHYTTSSLKEILLNLLKGGKSIENITYVAEKICDVSTNYPSKEPKLVAKEVCKLI